MDSLTHIVLGAAIGEAMLGKKLGKKGMLWGILANNFPDIDVLANFFVSPVDAMIFHRGITHSLFFGIVTSFLFAFLIHKKYVEKEISYGGWLKFFLVAIISHDVIDYFTTYGTGLLEPFSDERFSANSIFVADPFYTFPLLVTALVLLIIKGKRETRKAINTAGIILSLIYLLITFINKAHVDKVMRTNLEKQNISYSDYFTTPAPLNNFLWHAVAKDKFGYYSGYYSLFDKKDTIEFNYVPKNELILVLFPNDKDVQKLKKFSQGYYSFSKSDHSVYMNDLRFGQAAGWTKADSKYVFRYKLDTKGNEAALRRGDVDVSMREVFKSLVERIKGK